MYRAQGHALHRAKRSWPLVFAGAFLTLAATSMFVAVTASAQSASSAEAEDEQREAADLRATAEEDPQAFEQELAQRDSAWAAKPGREEAIESGDVPELPLPQGEVSESEAARQAASSNGQPLSNSTRSNIVSAAHSYLGTPYVWSNQYWPCNAQGADCECLNRLSYREGANMELTYTLQGQYDRGTPTNNPQPGDLVFWDYDGDGDFGPYDHTGVYAGNGQVYHASAYYDEVVKTPVQWVSEEAEGTYYSGILS